MPKTAKELEKILLSDGWYQVAQVGSHKHYKHPFKQGKITIPAHGSKVISIGTEKAILKQAEVENYVL